MKRLILAIALLLFPSFVHAQCAGVTSCTAAGVDSTSVQNALNSINRDNTTLTLPAGSATWTTTVTYNQSLSTTVKGQTIISGTCAPGGSCAATDNTTITLNTPATLVINTSSGKSFRWTGTTINVALSSAVYGALNFNGGSTAVRFDHNHVNDTTGGDHTIQPDQINGVFDHNLFDSTNQSNSFLVQPTNNGADGNANTTWTVPENFGSSQFVFFENNLIQNIAFAYDCDFGARLVFRYNIVGTNTRIQTHGTGSGAERRSCRAEEVYGNTFTFSATPNTNSFAFLVDYEGGPGMFWNNTITAFSTFLRQQEVRANNATYTQNATPTGWGYCGTAFNGTGSGWDQNSNANSGVYCLDQVGRGAGQLLTGNFPNKVNNSTGTLAWPNQARVPTYAWMNTLNTNSFAPNHYWSNFESPSRVIENTDYYIQLPNVDEGVSFNGTAGTGFGLLSARPATCTPGPGGNTTGVGYWATDTNTFYTCTGTNTWTTYYQPYTYPHPLTQQTGWTFIQDSIDTGCPTGSTCNYDNTVGLVPTTAGTVWVVAIQATNNVTITGVCSTGSGCSGLDSGWTLCPASKCHIFDTSRNLDMAYSFTGPANTTNVKVTLSGSPGSGPMGMNFFEFMPPPGSTPLFDDAGTIASSTCGPVCTGVALNVTGTDVVLQSLHFNSPQNWNAWSAPYLTLPLGEGLRLNDTTGAAPTVTVRPTGGAVTTAIAFKSTAGVFTPPPTGPISVVAYTEYDAANAPNCSPSPGCTITLPQTTGAGHLLYLQTASIAGNGGFITSVTGGGTWVVPTGANSCAINGSGNSLSCAYVLSSTAGASTITIKTAGSQNTPMDFWEVATTGTPFTFDTQGSASNAASYSPPGVPLTLGGSNDVIFQSAFVPGGTSSVSLYPYPRNPGCGIQFYCGQAANVALVNTTNGSAPVYANQQNNATVVTGIAFTSATPPQGPIISFSPNPLGFGSRVQGSSLTLTTTLTNTGGSNLVLSTPYDTITGANASDFTDTGAGTCSNGATITAGSSCTITVSYVPTSVGAELASLVINANASGSVTLTGSSVVVGSVIKGGATITGSATVVINP